MRLRLALALAAAASGSALAAAGPAAAALPFAPCTPAGFDCARLSVPLDRSGAVPGEVSLNIERAAAASNPGNDAVIALAGGPGQAAIPLASDFAQVLGPALGARDLIVFDQRGTGSSSPLDCAAFDSISSASAASAPGLCAQQLGPQRAFFRTSDSVEDIEAIRQAAGYDKLILFGVSYGTKVALAYAAAHPDHVESLVLDSVVAPDGPDVFRRSSFAAIGRVLSDLCQHGTCASISPSPRADLARLVKQLDRHSLRGVVVRPDGGRVRIAADELSLLQIVVGGDLNPALRAELPGSVRSALRGDPAPILRLYARAVGLNGIAGLASGPESDSDALFVTTRCEESTFPWDRNADSTTRRNQAIAAVEAVPSAAFAPFSRAAGLLGEAIPVCVGWPDASPPPAPPGPLPAVPTLILDGAADLRTPLEDAQRVAAQIPGAQVVAIPHTGHSALGSDLSSCARTAVAAFFGGQPVAQCPATANLFTPTPVAPTSLARVHGRTRAERTVRALLDTITDIRRQFIGDELSAGVPTAPGAATGGLRGGRAVYKSTGITFTRVAYVPGVLISGFEPFTRGTTARYTLAGTAAAHGTVSVLGDGRIVGRLDGRRVAYRVSSVRAARAGAAAAWQPRLPRLPRLARVR